MQPQRLSWHVDSRHGSAIVTVRGGLDGKGGSALYRALMQGLAGEPDAILVELSGMTVTDPDAAKIFPTIIQQGRHLAWNAPADLRTRPHHRIIHHARDSRFSARVQHDR